MRQRFDVTGNLEKFYKILETKRAHDWKTAMSSFFLLWNGNEQEQGACVTNTSSGAVAVGL